MLKFFKALRELEPNNRNLAVTLLEREFFGEKLLISGGSVVYQSSESMPGPAYLPKLSEVQNTGICSVEGARGQAQTPFAQNVKILFFQFFSCHNSGKN